jgi:acetylornithine deacetylase/succinyl-diaminopimelate desuccinylase-like protein
MTQRLAERVHWDGVREEVTEQLQRLIRFETVNPPGNESLVANYLRDVVEREGLTAQVLEAVPGRGNFVTRIAGAGRGRPLLLMAHSDVVSVKSGAWSHAPFAADLADGMLWGRGAVDTKNLVAAELLVMLLVQRMGLQLDRDLIMVTFADEEAGGEVGAEWMWHNHRDLFDAEFAINEGGGNISEVMGKRFYLCQTGEKGSAQMRLVARAAPGHASVPRDDTAMLRMGRALVKLTEHQFPTVLTPSVTRMLRAMSAALGGNTSALVERIVANPSWEQIDLLPLSEYEKLGLRATTRNTAVPTIIHGGHRINVIPGEVVCDVDGRVLPGEDPAAFVAQARELLRDDVEVEQVGEGYSGIEADPESALFDTIRAVMGELDPGAEVVPYLTSGGTDAKSLPGIKVYGFNPGHYNEAELSGAHNHNERVSVDNLVYSTRALFEIVTRYCQARPA